MTLEITQVGLLLPVSESLVDVLKLYLCKHAMPANASAVTFNFRDSNYSAESGGFHPVEIRLYKDQGLWQWDCITDFAYQGPMGMAELTKELDFNLQKGSAYSLLTGELTELPAHELYQLWESNFLSYEFMGCFDEIKVTYE